MTRCSSRVAACSLIFALSSASHTVGAAPQTPCSQWALGLIDIVQDNGPVVHLNVSATRAGFDGTASYTSISRDGAESIGRDKNGRVVGSLNHGQLHFKITWDGAVGIYDGSVAPDGHASGTTFNQAHPDNRAGWHAPVELCFLPGRTCHGTTGAFRTSAAYG